MVVPERGGASPTVPARGGFVFHAGGFVLIIFSLRTYNPHPIRSDMAGEEWRQGILSSRLLPACETRHDARELGEHTPKDGQEGPLRPATSSQIS